MLGFKRERVLQHLACPRLQGVTRVLGVEMPISLWRRKKPRGGWGESRRWSLEPVSIVLNTSFTILTETNAPCLPPPPPKFYITTVSNFSWVLQSSQEKSKTMVMQNFGEYTGCIMGSVKMVNTSFSYTSWLVNFDVLKFDSFIGETVFLVVGRQRYLKRCLQAFPL